MAEHSIRITLEKQERAVAEARRTVAKTFLTEHAGVKAKHRDPNAENRAISKILSGHTRLLQRIATSSEKTTRLTHIALRLAAREHRRTGGFGFGGGGGRPMFAGGGIGRMGASLPILGAALGAVGLLIGKAVEAGRAAMAGVERQVPTAGIGGYRVTGAGTYGPGDVSRFLYARRVAAGAGGREQEAFRMPTNRELRRIRREATRFGGDEYGAEDLPRIGRTVAETTAAFEERRRRESERGQVGYYGMQALRFARFTGMDVEQVGRMQGMMGVRRPGTGGREFMRTVAGLERGGIRTPEMRAVLDAMGQTLEEAVTAGIADSDIAGDMARSLVTMGRFFPEGTRGRAALGLQRTLAGTTRDVARGRWGGVTGFRTLQAAERVAGTREGMAALQQSRLFEGMDEGQIRSLMGRDIMVRRTAAQYLAERMSGRVQHELAVGMRRTFDPGEGRTPEERARRRARYVQYMGMQGDEGLPQTVTQRLAFREMGRERFAAPAKPMSAAETARRYRMPRTVESVLKFRKEQREQLLGTGGRFIEGAMALDRAMMSLARTGAVMAPTFSRVAKIANDLAGGLSGLVDSVAGSNGLIERAGQRIDLIGENTMRLYRSIASGEFFTRGVQFRRATGRNP